MIALDTNILVYAHRRDSTWHREAQKVVVGLAEGTAAWGIPWPCIHEFLAIVTHPRIYDPPTGPEAALAQVDAWIASPRLVMLTEGPGYIAHLSEMIRGAKVAGARIHDARVAALCVYHGVREIWSADRDFQRFPGVKVSNPLVG